jgi:small subunit ribosomal protein S1
MVLDIDEERRRISLGLKQCKSNPWAEFAENHGKGDKVSGQIKSITDFGVFIGLPGDIDGLVHLSDLSWELTGEEAVRNYKKGEELETTVLAIDPERERISLGVKQLDKDPLSLFVSENPKGSVVKGIVKEVDAKGATIELSDGVIGNLRASEISRDRIEDARTILKPEEEIEAKFVGIDRKSRVVTLSIKEKEEGDEAQAIQNYNTEAGKPASGTSLGDLLKEQMNSE